MRRHAIPVLGLMITIIAAATPAVDRAPELSPAAQSVADRAMILEVSQDLDALLEAIGDRPHVLLGAATQGTREFHTWRTQISQRLIQDMEFRFIAIEGEWTQAWEVNLYVKSLPGAAETAEEALSAFSSWPDWLWNNEEVLELINWLRAHNDELAPEDRVGFYGLDLLSPFDSVRAVSETLADVDMELAEELASLMACFAAHDDGQHYVQMLSRGGESCGPNMQRAYERLMEMEETLREADEFVFLQVQQHLRVARNAELHFRAILDPAIDSWNVRAEHFFETYDRLVHHHGDGARGIVWAHNKHIGDARQSAMLLQEQVNIGQLARDAYGRENVFVVGFGTSSGTVIAAAQRGAPSQEMRIPIAPPGTVEYLLDTIGYNACYFLTERILEPASYWYQTQPHRSIDVLYNPAAERGNYVPTILPRRYDAFIFISETRALSPR